MFDASEPEVRYWAMGIPVPPDRWVCASCGKSLGVRAIVVGPPADLVFAHPDCDPLTEFLDAAADAFERRFVDVISTSTEPMEG